MARVYRQRFNVTSSGQGPANTPSDDAYENVLKAEARAIDDFRKGLITADDAMAEFAASVRKYGRQAGLTVDARQADANRMESVLDRLASAMGQAGVSKEPPVDLTRFQDTVYDLTSALDKLPLARATEEADAERRMQAAVNKALQDFKDGLITADEAVRRQAAAVERFGEKARYDIYEREFEKGNARSALEEAAAATGKLGPSDPNGAGGVLGQLLKRFLPANSPLAGLLGQGDLLKAIGGGAGGGPPGIGAGFGGAGGGGLVGAIGQFAGPVALVAAGSKVMEGFYASVQQGTRRVGDVTAAIARNDGAAAVTGFIDGMGEAAGKVPVIGGMLEKQIGQYSQFVKTFDQVTAAFEQRGRELARYDGRLASADANATVVKLLTDIREAQELGTEYAAVIRERTTAQAELQQALIPIKRVLTQELVVALKFLNVNLKAIGVLADNFDQSMKTLNRGMADMVGDLKALNGNTVGIQVITKIMKDKFGKKGAEGNALLKHLLDFADSDLTVGNEFMPEREPIPPLGIDLFG